MSWYDYDDEPKGTANKRVQRELEKRRKQGEELTPVLPTSSRDLSTTFWGKAWNRNLMAYSDYESRMPRGRTYFRSGNVMELEIQKGRVESIVVGTRIYEVAIIISPLKPDAWDDLKDRCRGKIVDFMDLLAGELSDEVMREVTDLETGLFPSNREIKLSCSCPDYAGMCKHCAATLYAVGSMLDDNPRHLFKLRGVDPGELIGTVATTIDSLTTPSAQTGERAAALDGADLTALFGIDLNDMPDVSALLEPPPAKEKRAKKAL